MYGKPTSDLSPQDDILVEQVAPADINRWSDVYMDSRQVPKEARSNFLESHSILFAGPRWRLYLAFINSQPAAAGLMYLGKEGGSLAGAATLPNWRRRGCQSAILNRRISDAAEANYDLITSQPGPLASRRNMERQGMRLAYTKARWEQLRHE